MPGCKVRAEICNDTSGTVLACYKSTGMQYGVLPFSLLAFDTFSHVA
jgi:hypothetical protein